MSIQMACGICGKNGHNRTTCTENKNMSENTLKKNVENLYNKLNEKANQVKNLENKIQYMKENSKILSINNKSLKKKNKDLEKSYNHAQQGAIYYANQYECCMDMIDNLRQAIRQRDHIEQTVVEKIPMHIKLEMVNTYKEDYSNGKNIIECPICMDTITPSTLSITNCGHKFCTTCRDKIRCRDARCPTCRTDLT